MRSLSLVRLVKNRNEKKFDLMVVVYFQVIVKQHSPTPFRRLEWPIRCRKLAGKVNWNRAAATRKANAEVVAHHRRRLYPTGVGVVVRTTWTLASSFRVSCSIHDNAARTFTRGFICTIAMLVGR